MRNQQRGNITINTDIKTSIVILRPTVLHIHVTVQTIMDMKELKACQDFLEVPLLQE